ncbi:MAG: hypothetical protein JWP03_90 [Phycisphaerales bacterium]|nr:hypothetical protein [Phycisphaerales bacterium]
MLLPTRRNLLAFTLAGAALAAPAVACGPFFPNQLLFNSGQSLAWAPVADFDVEIARIATEKPVFHALVPARNKNVFDQTTAIDLEELGQALDSLHTPAEKRLDILQKYTAVRAMLTQDSMDAEKEDKHVGGLPPGVASPLGLPAEFDLYLRGVLSFRMHKDDEARAVWGALLQLPPGQRIHRTVWAQFMIGKSYLESDPARAGAAFEKVRELVTAGAKDSLGLAASSLGWEARAEFLRRQEARAIRLYLDQYATGDPTAVESLAIVCGKIFRQNDPKLLQSLAADATASRVITACALARGGHFHGPPAADAVKQWLVAVEASGTAEIVGADRLAWSAYQAGDMASAERWIRKAAPAAPTAQWIKSKLLLRAGKLDAAAEAMAGATRAFPQEEIWSNVPGAYEPRERSAGEGLRPGRRIEAELGVLQLARGQYVESMGLLLKSGWWLDAAYVAERVLTVDELVGYVGRNCPEGTHDNLRHLLARRLTRVGRWKEARPYFPDKLRSKLDEYISDIRTGHDATLAPAERAAALWNAAKIARNGGMQLLGTELSPDDFADGGNYPGSDIPAARQASKDKLLPPADDEIQRVARSGPEPDRRWHYRYTAADHAWAAAQLMPDGSEALAELLCEAGGWLKSKDPTAAERFYKALITRCGETKSGRAAKEKHWFPDPVNGPK